MYHYSEIELDALEVPRVVPPSQSQKDLMDQLSHNSGVKITHDRNWVLYFNLPERNAGGIFVHRNEMSCIRQHIIVLNEHANSGMWLHVLLHELAHATGSQDNLKRFDHRPYQDRFMRHWEEAIADLTASKVEAILKVQTPDAMEFSEGYVNRHFEIAAVQCGKTWAELEEESNKAVATLLQWCENTYLMSKTHKKAA